MAPRMRGGGGGGGSSLSARMNSEVHMVVTKYLSAQDELEPARQQPATVSVIYNQIQRSKTRLARTSKAILEPIIERVLDQMRADEDSEDLGAIEGEFDGIEVEPKATNDMNKQLVKKWQNVRGETSVDELSPKMKRTANGEPALKRRKAAREADRATSNSTYPTHVSLEDLGGVDDIILQLQDLLMLALKVPSLYINQGLQPTRGILLHGPPGCGKTMIANAIAAALKVPFLSISAPSIVSGMSGESEKALRDHFDEAKKIAPCMIFIDEIDAITPKRENAQREMEKRIVAQLLTCMDELSLEKTNGKAVIVLAATNRPDSLDPALRRGGRFDKEINMSVPSESVREQILKALTRKMKCANIDYKSLARATPGFVGADLSDLVATTGAVALKRLLEQLKLEARMTSAESDDIIMEGPMEGEANTVDLTKSRVIEEFLQLSQYVDDQKHRLDGDSDLTKSFAMTQDDFMTALPRIQPSAKREGFATIPDTTWEDIGALQDVRESLMMAIVNPIRAPEAYERIGLTTPTGVLLWGPPGCGKTLLAKAVANESRANFISIKGPELLNKYVGESERAVRQVFARARSSVPCVIFIDELDAIVPKRDDTLSEASSRVVNQLLTELDGVDGRNGIYVIGATNRPDVIDDAMLRPGRLAEPLFVGLPGDSERQEILATLTRKHRLQESPSLEWIQQKCQGFSGADLGSLVTHAKMEAIKRDGGMSGVGLRDIEAARVKVKPSVSDKSLKRYMHLRDTWGA